MPPLHILEGKGRPQAKVAPALCCKGSAYTCTLCIPIEYKQWTMFAAGSRLMPQHTNKVLADEEMARRLHEELNGPEVSPAAAATRRNRKAPTFYTPPVHPPTVGRTCPTSGVALCGGCTVWGCRRINGMCHALQLPGSLHGQAAEGSGPSDDEGGVASERQLPSSSGDEKARAEKAGSSAGKRAGRKAQAMDDDSAEGSPGHSRHRSRAHPCNQGRWIHSEHKPGLLTRCLMLAGVRSAIEMRRSSPTPWSVSRRLPPVRKQAREVWWSSQTPKQGPTGLTSQGRACSLWTLLPILS